LEFLVLDWKNFRPSICPFVDVCPCDISQNIALLGIGVFLLALPSIHQVTVKISGDLDII
jgi:hypothetical protein